jgi:outer membrane immunogenic protein
MKLIHLSSASLVAFLAAAAPAFAADMPVKAAAVKAAAVAAPFNWSGIYVGGTVGYGFGDTHQLDQSSTARSPDFDWKGFVAGGTLGANWQSGMWVFGVETDLSWSNIDGSLPDSGAWGCTGNCRNEVERFGTARVRVGAAFDRFLPYATGGFAYGRLHSEYGPCSATSCNDWRENGWTAGAGAEWAFAPNWSAKLEYLYVDLGSTANNPDPGLEAKFHVVRFGLNYRFAWGKSPAPVVTKY